MESFGLLQTKIQMFLFFIASTYAATTIYTTLNQKAFPNFSWTRFKLIGNHTNREPNQPPNEWTNMTFDTPPWGLSMQFTHNFDGSNDTFVADVTYYAVDDLQAKVLVSFVWWSDSPIIWVGTGLPC